MRALVGAIFFVCAMVRTILDIFFHLVLLIGSLGPVLGIFYLIWLKEAQGIKLFSVCQTPAMHEACISRGGICVELENQSEVCP